MGCDALNLHVEISISEVTCARDDDVHEINQ